MLHFLCYALNMRIYFSGIGGVAIGPLAEIALEAGHDVCGSDAVASSMTTQLKQRGIPVFIGQTGAEIAKAHAAQPIDWLVVSAAITEHHPEVQFAKAHGIRISKRDELLNEIITQSGQKLIAVSGTHGKTTTTGMLVWLFQKLGVPASYSVGTTIGFGPSGHFDPSAQFFLYEADEYDRNMLRFKPHASILVSVDYDHPDIYPTPDDYKQAFRDFIAQSGETYLWRKDQTYLELADSNNLHLVDDVTLPSPITLSGEHNRRNATLAATCVATIVNRELSEVIAAVSSFPGTGRRFEKLAENLYTDYAHHPAEIAVTLQQARELSSKVVVVYQPHQNIRQHEIADEYKDCFKAADHVYWLPTYLSREDPDLPVLTPQQLIAKLTDPTIAEAAEMDEALLQHIRTALQDNCLVLCMGAGTIDSWIRSKLPEIR